MDFSDNLTNFRRLSEIIGQFEYRLKQIPDGDTLIKLKVEEALMGWHKQRDEITNRLHQQQTPLYKALND